MPPNDGQTWRDRWSQRLDDFFQKVAVLDMDGEKKGAVALSIKEGAGTGKLYWIALVLSAIIGALGLIQGSGAVVIGAMLIAPFLGPIQGFAFGITNGEHKVFIISVRTLFISVIVSVLIGYLASRSIGFFNVTSEIIARTQPTILDLLIALSSGVLAFLSLRFARLNASIAGVAMASALLPPLLVVGIELSLGDALSAGRAFFLFFTNLVAILVAGIVMLFLFGYSTHVSRQLQTLKNSLIVFIIFAIMVVPLVSSLISATERAKLSYDAQVYLDDVLTSQIGGHSILGFRILSVTSGNIILESEVLIPEGVPVYAETQQAIEQSMYELLGMPVDLRLSITRSVTLVSKKSLETASEPTKEDEYKSVLSATWSEILNDYGLTLEHLDTEFVGTSANDFKPQDIQKIVFFVRAHGNLTQLQYDTLSDRLGRRVKNIFPVDADINLQITPQYTYFLSTQDGGDT